MKKIGFIDLYISEWHANNYPAWIKEANERMGEDFVVKYVYAEKDVSPVDGRSTDEWCKAFGTEKCNSIEELCEKSDYIIILAPSNPETHLKYASIALKYGKNTYIDKTFAQSLDEAKQIFDVAETYNTRFFTSSALRYSTEVEELAGKCDGVTILDGGASVDEYIVHQSEMLVRLMGIGALRVRSEKMFDQYIFRIDYPENKHANIVFCENYGLRTGIIPHTKDTVSKHIPVRSEFFKGLIADILGFFVSSKLPFDPAETIEVMRLRDAIIKATEKDGEWISL